MPAAAHRPDIEGLRAVAVIAVLAFHLGIGSASGGFVGVDVFFVISGFLIGGIVVREAGGGGFSLSGYLMRRVKRSPWTATARSSSNFSPAPRSARNLSLAVTMATRAPAS